jgi:hypothetical protein
MPDAAEAELLSEGEREAVEVWYSRRRRRHRRWSGGGRRHVIRASRQNNGGKKIMATSFDSTRLLLFLAGAKLSMCLPKRYQMVPKNSSS